MQVVGLSPEEIQQVFQLLAAILWTGNVQFVESGNSDNAVVQDSYGGQCYIISLLDNTSEFIDKSSINIDILSEALDMEIFLNIDPINITATFSSSNPPPPLAALEMAAYLYGVEASILEQKFLTRLMESGSRRGSVYNVPMNVLQANAARDALAKVGGGGGLWLSYRQCVFLSVFIYQSMVPSLF